VTSSYDIGLPLCCFSSIVDVYLEFTSLNLLSTTVLVVLRSHIMLMRLRVKIFMLLLLLPYCIPSEILKQTIGNIRVGAIFSSEKGTEKNKKLLQFVTFLIIHRSRTTDLEPELYRFGLRLRSAAVMDFCFVSDHNKSYNHGEIEVFTVFNVLIILNIVV
jgi:hypothetical protein